MILDKQTYKRHIVALHVDAAMLVESLKRELSNPLWVCENKAAKSDNALLEVKCDPDHPYMLVAIKKRGPFGTRMISTWHEAGHDYKPKGKVIWRRK